MGQGLKSRQMRKAKRKESLSPEVGYLKHIVMMIDLNM